MIFGGAKFSIAVRNFVLSEKGSRFSQLEVIISGDGWVLHAPNRDETLGVVSGRIADFAARSPARHWGAFVGLGTAEDTIDRVKRHAFGGENPSKGDFHRWEMSSAFAGYSLSACFENGLGVEQAISVRGAKHETLIWESLSGELQFASIPAANFDDTCAAFVEWANNQIEAGSGTSGQ